MSIKENGYRILKYLSLYDDNAMVRNSEVYTALNISERDFNNAAAVCFTFKYASGGKTHLGITPKGRLYLEDLERDLLLPTTTPVMKIPVNTDASPNNLKKWITKNRDDIIVGIIVVIVGAVLLKIFHLV